MFFHFVKYKLDTIKLKTKLFAGSKRGTLFAAFLRAVSYIAIQDEIPMINRYFFWVESAIEMQEKDCVWRNISSH